VNYNNIKIFGGIYMFDFITNSNLFCKMEMAVWDAEDKIKDKLQYAKEHPIETSIKAALSIATINSACTAIKSIKALDAVVEDVTLSYICGKTAEETTDLSLYWAKLALQDYQNKALMKKAVEDIAKTAGLVVIDMKMDRR
jgi:hypothetical protein